MARPLASRGPSPIANRPVTGCDRGFTAASRGRDGTRRISPRARGGPSPRSSSSNPSPSIAGPAAVRSRRTRGPPRRAPLGAPVQPGDRDALVVAVEHVGELDARGLLDLDRREPVPAGAELGEVLGVGEAGDHVRHHGGVGLARAPPGGRSHRRAARRSARSRSAARAFMTSSSTSGPSTARSSRRKSSVDCPGSVRPSISTSGDPGDHVGLCRRRGSRSATRCWPGARPGCARPPASGRRRSTRARTSGWVKSLSSGPRHRRLAGGDRLEELPQIRGRVDREASLAQGGHRLGHPHHRAVGPRHRAVAGVRRASARAPNTQPFLSDLDRIERRVAEVQREPAGLADRVLGAGPARGAARPGTASPDRSRPPRRRPRRRSRRAPAAACRPRAGAGSPRSSPPCSSCRSRRDPTGSPRRSRPENGGWRHWVGSASTTSRCAARSNGAAAPMPR
jgi:hypothetical protein